MRRTKIIATLGPASSSREVVSDMIDAGMNAARINMSHGTEEEYREKVALVKEVREAKNTAVAIIMDTKGPEVRIKTFKDGRTVVCDGDLFTLTAREVEGSEKEVSISYPDFARNMKAGTTVLVDDGRVALEVEKVEDSDVVCKVVHGGEISNRKGVNVPDVAIDMEYISEQDEKDLALAAELGVDYVAASFVRSQEDVLAVRNFLDANGGEEIAIISKIENAQGIDAFDEILKVSDGIMVARGDMGVEIAFERLPAIQKKLISRCIMSGKIAITATEMLESMVKNELPTRAEITDVANAVFDGTSVVMLSGETAVGVDPVNAVSVMSRIAEQAEKDMVVSGRALVFKDRERKRRNSVTEAMGRSASNIASDIGASAIMAITKSGYTASQMARFRPEIPILALTPYESTYYRLALEWGVQTLMVENSTILEDLMQDAIQKAKKRSFVKKGDRVVMTAGLPLNVTGNTNIIRVAYID